MTLPLKKATENSPSKPPHFATSARSDAAWRWRQELFKEAYLKTARGFRKQGVNRRPSRPEIERYLREEKKVPFSSANFGTTLRKINKERSEHHRNPLKIERDASFLADAVEISYRAFLKEHQRIPRWLELQGALSKQIRGAASFDRTRMGFRMLNNRRRKRGLPEFALSKEHTRAIDVEAIKQVAITFKHELGARPVEAELLAATRSKYPHGLLGKTLRKGYDAELSPTYCITSHSKLCVEEVMSARENYKQIFGEYPSLRDLYRLVSLQNPGVQFSQDALELTIRNRQRAEGSFIPGLRLTTDALSWLPELYVSSINPYQKGVIGFQAKRHRDDLPEYFLPDFLSPETCGLSASAFQLLIGIANKTPARLRTGGCLGLKLLYEMETRSGNVREILHLLRERWLPLFTVNRTVQDDLNTILSRLTFLERKNHAPRPIDTKYIVGIAAGTFTLRASRLYTKGVRRQGFTKIELLSDAISALARAAHFATTEAQNLSRVQNMKSK